MYCYCFEYGNASSSLEQGKKLQHFLSDRVAKFTSCLEQGQGLVESAKPPYPIPVEYTPWGRIRLSLIEEFE